MYVFVCICICVYIIVYVYTRMHTQVYNTHVCINIGTLHTFEDAYVFACIDAYVFACMYVCTCM